MRIPLGRWDDGEICMVEETWVMFFFSVRRQLMKTCRPEKYGSMVC